MQATVPLKSESKLEHTGVDVPHESAGTHPLACFKSFVHNTSIGILKAKLAVRR